MPGACLACLFALVNVPSALLLGWLLAASPAASPLPHAFAAAGLAGGILGSVLLCVLVERRGRSLRQALAESGEQAERLRCVVETAAHPILTIDDGGRILSANAATGHTFGHTPGDLIGQPLVGLLSREVAGRVSEARTGEHRVLGAGRPIEAFRKDGSRFPASLAVTKSRQAGPSFYVVLIQDLTEISQTRHAAEAATRTKDSFLGRLNHELRTPLTGILGTIDLLRDTPLGDAQARDLDVIQELAEALLQGFNQLADYARLEAGQMQLRREPFSLRETVALALAPLLPLARGKGLRLNVQISPDVPDQFEGDAGRLGQVLMNLAGNAVKFTPAGEVTIQVKGEEGRAKNGKAEAGVPSPSALHPSPFTLHFEVLDTGIGIPADRLEAIFEPFEQADGSATRRHGGMGLGLSVASRLAGLMGGRIEARSEPGQGSRFRFELSLQAVQSAPYSSRCVLVVLAHDQDRLALERHLSDWGIRATSARNGRQALTELLRAVVEGSPYGLVLIEEHLPDLSAREVLHRLRHRSEAPPPALMLGRSETDVPLPDGVLAVLPRRATPLQTYQAVLRAFTAPAVLGG
jgi:PAS domain S-box-containing protein